MDADDFVKGVVAALLTDQVDKRTGLVFKVALLALAAAVAVMVATDGGFRWMAVVGTLLILAFLVFVLATRWLARRVIHRFAPPVDVSGSRRRFDTALAEADLPTGPLSLLRLVWRLRRGVGPEITRLAAAVGRFRSDLG